MLDPLTPYRILVVDDEAEVLSFFRYMLRRPEYAVVTAQNRRAVQQALAGEPFDLALVDLKLPDTDGLEVLTWIREAHPGCRVVIMTGYSTVKSAVQAVQLGAYDYMEKPFADLTELERLIERALGAVRAPAGDRPALAAARAVGLITGGDERMARLIELAYVMAQKPATVLILGETGAGKEVMARFIHRCSPRADGPFVAVNCAALAETLLESELFGHEKGAFTGATATRRGIFELADGGTLLLDEIGEASPSAQAKLLRLLETGTFQRVGGERSLRADVRIIAATNRPLEEAVRQGTFRSDLFYRLDVVTLHLPPLRERLADLPALVEHLLALHGSSAGGRRCAMDPQALELLARYPWPGNVRELANVLLRAATVSPDGRILPQHLPDKLWRHGQPVPVPPPAPEPAPAAPNGDAGHADPGRLLQAWVQEAVAAAGGRLTLTGLLERLREAEQQAVRELIHLTLRDTLGNRREAARRLGVTPRILKYHLYKRP